MARHRKRRNDPFPATPYLKNRVRDDSFHIASDFSDRVFEPVTVADTPYRQELADQYFNSVRSILSEVEDRRTYHPGGRDSRPPSSPRRHLVSTTPKFTNASARVFEQFKAPAHALVCVRRKIRDQVLHALRKTGKGSGRPRRFNQFSKVKC